MSNPEGKNWDTWERIVKAAGIQAYAILRDGKAVASLILKRSKSGRVTALVWNIGEDPQIGHAGGAGYDKHSAALDGLNVAGVVIDGTVSSNWDNQLVDAGLRPFSVTR